jgi:hypothetical protein
MYFSNTSEHSMNSTQNKKTELIVVFSKEITLTQAKNILNQLNVIYREGMDSSKGKQYYNKTGPKFITSFKNSDEKNHFIELISKNKKEIYGTV